MKYILMITALIISMITGYLALFSNKQAEPEIIFTPNFSMAEIKFPEALPTKTMSPTLVMAVQSTEADTPSPVKLKAPLEAMTPNPKAINETKARADNYKALQTSDLMKHALQGSHAIFEHNNFPYDLFSKSIKDLILTGYSDEHGNAVQQALSAEYPQIFEQLDALCSNVRCMVVAVIPKGKKFSADYCSTHRSSVKNCSEYINVIDQMEYSRQSDLNAAQCDLLNEDLLNFEFMESITLTAEEELAQQKKMAKFWQCMEAKKDDSRFARRYTLEFQSKQNHDYYLVPFNTHAIELLDESQPSDNLTQKMKDHLKAYFQQKETQGELKLMDLIVKCRNKICRNKATISTQIEVDKNILLPHFEQVLENPPEFCTMSGTTKNLQDSSPYQLTGKLLCNLPANTSLFSNE